MRLFTKDNIEIECTPEEFVTLMKDGVFGDTIADQAASPGTGLPGLPGVPQVTPGKTIPQNPYDTYPPESYKAWLGKLPIATVYGVDSIQVTPVYGCQVCTKPFPDSTDLVYTGETTDNLQQFFGKPSDNTAELRDTEPEHPDKANDDKETES